MNLINPEIYAGCINVYDDVIDFSEELIDYFNKQENWSGSPVFVDSNSLETKIDNSVRSNSSLVVNQFSYDNDLMIYKVAKTVWEYVNDYAKYHNVKFDSTEYMQILKYSVGEKYETHYDYGYGTPRVISALLYLNDVNYGGETEFVNFNLKINPKEGRLVIFPSNYAYAHKALPPENGEKYVIAFWMHG